MIPLCQNPEHPRALRRGAIPGILSLLLVLPWSAEGFTLARKVVLMGTYFELVLVGEEEQRLWELSETAIRIVQEWEQALSTWSEESELSRFNKASPGRWFPLSPRLQWAWEAMEFCYRESGGAFDPGILALEELWDLRGEGRIPERFALEALLPRLGWRHLERRGGVARRLTQEVKIEEGGVAKGLALREALTVLKQVPGVRGSLNLGGQVVLWGAPATLAIADPFQRSLPLLYLEIAEGGISTSSQELRKVQVAGKELGHILDPKRGVPVEFHGSISLLARDPLAADCFSTALLVMEEKEQLRWLKEHPGYAMVKITRAGKAYTITTSRALKQRLTPARALPLKWVFYD